MGSYIAHEVFYAWIIINIFIMKINMQIYLPFDGKICIYLVATNKWLKL